MPKSSKTELLKARLESHEQNVQSLEESSDLLVYAHQKEQMRMQGVQGQLSTIARREPCKPLSEAIHTLATKMQEIETNRTDVLGILQLHVVQQLKAYRPEIAVRLDDVKRRDTAFSEYVSKQEELHSLQSKKTATSKKVMRADHAVQSERSRMANIESDLNEKLSDYERRRITDMKVCDCALS